MQLVLEGDYLLPSLAAQPTFGDYPNNGRVVGLVVHEEVEEQFDRAIQEERAARSFLLYAAT